MTTSLLACRLPISLSFALGALVGAVSPAAAQPDIAPQNDAPNPYVNRRRLGEAARDGREWGSTGGVDMDRDGKHVWVAERCGGNSCAGLDLDPVLKFDPEGNLVTSFGAGLMIQPHGLHVDPEGNVWVTDAQGPDGLNPHREGKGHVAMKFSPEGELLMTLGRPGVGAAGQDTLDQPCDVVVANDGTIYVADGHGGQQPGAGPHTTARVVKFAPDGSYLAEWGSQGNGPGHFRTPHAIDLDSRGRVVVADRGNDRLQVFDPDGAFIEEFYQYSRPSGLHIADGRYGLRRRLGLVPRRPAPRLGVRHPRRQPPGRIAGLVHRRVEPRGGDRRCRRDGVRRRRGVRRRPPQVRAAGCAGQPTVSAPSAGEPAMNDGLTDPQWFRDARLGLAGDQEELRGRPVRPCLPRGPDGAQCAACEGPAAARMTPGCRMSPRVRYIGATPRIPQRRRTNCR